MAGIRSLYIPGAFVQEVTVIDGSVVKLAHGVGDPVDYHVDWGDGSSNDITDFNSPDIEHTYTDAGAYIVSIDGIMEDWNVFGTTQTQRNHWTKVLQWGYTDTTSRIFRRAYNIDFSEVVDVLVMKPSVIGLAQMFRETTSLTTVPFIGDWNMEQYTLLTTFLLSCSLSTSSYDELLLGWSTQSLKSNVTLDMANSKYTGGGAVATARQKIIDDFNWTINDLGIA